MRALDERVREDRVARSPVVARLERLDGRVEVAGRRRRVATTGMDPAEAQLDRRQPCLVGGRGGGLEGGDGTRVVALRRADLAQHRLDAGDVRMPERERGLEVRAGLVQRVQRARAEPRRQERFGSLDVATGVAFMDGDLDEPRGVVAAGGVDAKQVRGSAVQEAAPRQARALVDGVAEARVREVERRPRRRRRPRGRGLAAELLQRADGLVLGTAARPADEARGRTSAR